MRGSSVVTQTVILAAGMGSRLANGSARICKPLVTVGGVSLIARALDHARASGCTEAVVVTGYEGLRVREAVSALAGSLTIRFAECPDPSAPNGVSLLAAAPHADSRFFLQMVDHLFAEPTLPALAAEPLGQGEDGRVLVDRQPPKDLDLGDATKVRVEGGRVEAIGKGLEPWHAIDAGCFLLTPAVFEALREVRSDEPLTVSSGMRRLAARHALGVAAIDGTAWVDLDTPLDLEAAERLLFALR